MTPHEHDIRLMKFRVKHGFRFELLTETTMSYIDEIKADGYKVYNEFNGCIRIGYFFVAPKSLKTR